MAIIRLPTSGAYEMWGRSVELSMLPLLAVSPDHKNHYIFPNGILFSP